MPTSGLIASQAVFNIFSLEDLVTHVFGKTLAGLVANETGRSRSTVENWFKTQAISKLVTAIGNLLPETSRDALHHYFTGQFPYPSNLGGLLYPQLGDLWFEYRCSLKQLHNMEAFELANREHFPTQEAAPLIAAILAAREVRLGTSPEEGRRGPRTVTAGRLTELESDWEKVVATAFFHQLAALDIDACQSNFAGKKVRMLLPLVFPSQRSGLTGTLYSSPELNLLELMYCAVMGVFDAPTQKEMFSTLDADMETKYRGKLRWGTFRLDDYYSLTTHWWRQRPLKAAMPEPSDEEAQRRSAFLLVLFVAARACSFVFQDVPHDDQLWAILHRFLNNYRDAWHFQVAVRGIDLAVGTPWEAT